MRRIVPMYVLVLVLFLVVAPLAAELMRGANIDNRFVQAIPKTDGVNGVQWVFVVFGQNLTMFARNAFLHPSLGVTWSLAVEVQFYVAWFFLMRRSDSTVRRVAAAAIVFGPVFRAALAVGGVSVTRIYVLPLSHADLFGWGTLLALWYRNGTSVGWLKSKLTIITSALAFGGWLVLADRPTGQTGMTPGQLSVGITIAALAIAACVHRVLTDGGALDRVLRAPALTFLGAISYSLYLTHTAVEHVFRRLVIPHTGLEPFIRHHELAGQLLIFGLVGAVSIAVAMVTYKLVEQRYAGSKITTGISRSVFSWYPA